jgi:hypothetical protein
LLLLTSSVILLLSGNTLCMILFHSILFFFLLLPIGIIVCNFSLSNTIAFQVEYFKNLPVYRSYFAINVLGIISTNSVNSTRQYYNYCFPPSIVF